MLPLCMLLASVVTLELERPPQLSAEETATLERFLAAALAAHPEAASAVDERLVWSVDVGATRIQLLAERMRGDHGNGRDARVGPRDVGAWDELTRALIDDLYGTRARAFSGTAPPAPAAPRGAIAWAPVLVLTAGTAALAGSIAFGADRAAASQTLSSVLLTEPELGELRERSTVSGAMAISFAVGAVACAAIGAWLIADP